MEALLSCAKCRMPLVRTRPAPATAIAIDSAEPLPCPSCGTPTILEVFPAMFRPPELGSAGEKLTSAEEAACFYHPQKRASVPCDSCGRFLCALCDVQLHGQHLCPACIQSGAKKGKIKNLENERKLHDNMALGLAFIWLTAIGAYFTFITAPMAIYISIRHWNTPMSILPRRSRLRFVIAILMALCEIAGWIFLVVFWVGFAHKRGGR